MKKIKFLISLLFLAVFLQTSKAADIHIYLPTSSPKYYCESAGYDRFIVHKVTWFVSPIWYLNGNLAGAGDSLIFNPTAPGIYTIVCSWNSNNIGVTLCLSVAVPSHPVFTVVSGGSFNSRKDTIWKCASSVVVSANYDPNQSFMDKWYGPGGFNSTSNPVTLTVPGMYYHERFNSCGYTRDTFQLVQLPTTLPVLHDTVFCNTAVSVILDAGPGWFSRQWYLNNNIIPGAINRYYTATVAGDYKVYVSNACLNGTSNIAHVMRYVYPLPDLHYQEGPTLCPDSVVTLDPSPGHTYTTYLWSTNETTPTITISGSDGGSGIYSVTVTEGTCTATASGEFNFYEEPVKPEICIVTVNSTANKNMIVWTNDNEPPPGSLLYSKIQKYKIYKWAGASNWTLLGTVPVTQEHTFVDMTSNPPVVSARYKITMIDSCDFESEKSFYHQTILLSVMNGQNPGEVPLIWTEYKDESNTFIVDNYQIWRGDSPNNLSYYTQTPFTSYNDTGVYTQKYYQIVVTKPGGCDPNPLSKGKTLISGSMSNITRSTIGINEFESPKFSIYPNPSDGIFHIEGGEISRADIMDNLGKALYTSTSKTINLCSYAPGMYYVRIYNKNGSTSYHKLIVR